MPDGYLAVGKIIGVHGLKGEVKVESYSDVPDRFVAGDVLALGDDLEPLTVRSARPHKGNVLVTFDDVEGRTEAESLRGMWLYVPDHPAADLNEDTYWVHDILGMKVVGDDGVVLGIVDDVLFTGANDVYVVRRGAGRDNLLLPATDEVIRSINLENRQLTVHLIPGLLE